MFHCSRKATGAMSIRSARAVVTTNRSAMRGHDDGVSSLNWATRASCGFLTPMGRGCELNDGRVVPNFCTRRLGKTDDGLRRRKADAQFLLCDGFSRRDSHAGDSDHPSDQFGRSQRAYDSAIRRTYPARRKARRRSIGRCRKMIPKRGARIFRRRRRCWAGSLVVGLAEGLKITIYYSKCCILVAL